MSNANNVFTTQSIVDDDIRLIVPIYQRLFFWD